MARRRLRGAPLVVSLLLAGISCRSVLDITPGRPLEDLTGGSASNPSGGKTSSSNGGSKSNDGGGVQAGSGGTTASAGKGSGGSSKGGASAQGGSMSAAGQGLGGDGGSGSPAMGPFPEGACRDCMDRNCAAEQQACADDATCSDGVSTWLACTEADASKCVDSEAGPLQDLEACGAKSCDFCRHLSDNAPSIEILTPSNGAAIALDTSGLIEVSVRARNVVVKTLGQCGTNTNCGHVHLNLDGANCHRTPFYNQWIIATDADGNADSAIDTQYCVASIVGRPLALTASLSDYQSHADRIPAVQSTVTITVSK
jgi:hypothetical protein